MQGVDDLDSRTQFYDLGKRVAGPAPWPVSRPVTRAEPHINFHPMSGVLGTEQPIFIYVAAIDLGPAAAAHNAPRRQMAPFVPAV